MKLVKQNFVKFIWQLVHIWLEEKKELKQKKKHNNFEFENC